MVRVVLDNRIAFYYILEEQEDVCVGADSAYCTYILTFLEVKVYLDKIRQQAPWLQ